MTEQTLHAPHGRTLTATERQVILRRLKHGPVLSREKLASYANKVSQEVKKGNSK